MKMMTSKINKHFEILKYWILLCNIYENTPNRQNIERYWLVLRFLRSNNHK